MSLYIKCPYCKTEHDGLDYIETGDMEGEFEMICENEECAKKFQVKFTTTISFKTSK